MIETRTLVRFVVVIGFILALLVSQIPVVRSDFASFYAAGTIVRTNPTRLYDQDLQFDIQEGVGKMGYLPFAYPPTTALIFAPISLLDFQAAYFAWLLGNFVLLLLCLRQLAGRLRLLPSQADALLVFTLLFFPVYAALVQGQLSILILLFFTLFLTEDRNERSGLWAGLLLIKPHLAFIPFLVVILSRNWKALVVGVSTGLIHALLSIALLGLAGFQRYLGVLTEMSTNREITAWLPRMHNLRHISWFLGTGEAGYFVIAAVAVLTFSFAWTRTGRSKWNLLAVVLLSCLVSPHLFLHDVTLGLAAAALLISMRRPHFGFAEQTVWAVSSLLGLLALNQYPIFSGLMLAVFVISIVKSRTSGLRGRAGQSASDAPGLTEVHPPAH